MATTTDTEHAVTESYDTIVAALRAVADALPGRANEIAAARRLPADLVVALKEAGAFRLAVPSALGGPELTLREQTQIIEMLAYVEPSVAWCVMIGSDSPYYSAFMDADTARTLWPSNNEITAGLVQPAGRALPVEGGYRISGRWAFGSGCTHADVIVGGCMVVDDAGAPVFDANGSPDWIIAAAPADQWSILDTWHTTGLAGSGSNDYTVTDMFVPRERCFRFSDPITRTETLFAFRPAFVANLPGVPLGIARRSIDIVRDIAANKLILPEFVMMRDLARVRSAIGHAEVALGASRAYVYDSLDRLWACLSRGDEPDPDLRAAVGLARAHACEMARDVVRSMCDTVGASSIYDTNPLERLNRDAITVAQHIVAQERMFEMGGELLLTGSTAVPLL